LKLNDKQLVFLLVRERSWVQSPLAAPFYPNIFNGFRFALSLVAHPEMRTDSEIPVEAGGILGETVPVVF
jgi:hypothetical protein